MSKIADARLPKPNHPWRKNIHANVAAKLRSKTRKHGKKLPKSKHGQ